MSGDVIVYRVGGWGRVGWSAVGATWLVPVEHRVGVNMLSKCGLPRVPRHGPHKLKLFLQTRLHN